MYDVILSGKITGDPDYRVKFARACVATHQLMPGKRIWNPAELPPDRDYLWYMKQCMGVILNEAAEGCVVVRLTDWHESPGARAECSLAECLGLAHVEQWW